MSMQRLQRYKAFPRVRSNSLSTLTVTQPSSSSRPVLQTPPRLPSEAPKQSQHSQLALTQPTTGLQPPLFPCNPPIAPNFNPAPSPASSSFAAPSSDSPRAAKRQRLRYQLDVGAYGIPKNRSNHHHPKSSSYPHSHLSVQVGEDAYFVRDNAMGIADGVGGWARSVPQSSHHPTPSALFSRRLMHFCSAEIDALSTSLEPTDTTKPTSSSGPAPGTSSTATRPPTAQFSFEHHLKPRPPPTHSPYDTLTSSELEDSLNASLEELSDGFNVLNILERAYDQTVKAHVSPTSTPLTTGSSTALLAVLDHPPPPGVHTLPQNPEAPHKNYAAGSIQDSIPSTTAPTHSHPSSSKQSLSGGLSIPLPVPIPDAVPRSVSANDITNNDGIPTPEKPIEFDAVIRIAHLGDCMGMLIRGDAIAWRSDEMWWGYNHPLQLGPPSAFSSTIPSSSTSAPTPEDQLSLPVKPHTFTLPVRADDILILASDGLSDNLWDEDVLDEVLKFRRQEGWGFTDTSHSDVKPLQSAFASMNLDESTSHPASTPPASTHTHTLLRRKAFSGMLSEALCSRAKRISERRPPASPSSVRRRTASTTAATPKFSVIAEESEVDTTTRASSSFRSPSVSLVTSQVDSASTLGAANSNRNTIDPDEIPFARRARLAGKSFRGGKHDDISVIVAVISPTPTPSPSPPFSSLGQNTPDMAAAT